MKKIWLIGVLILGLALPHLSLSAQETDPRLTSGSGRYSLAAPEGWFASSEPQIPQIQGFFPQESLTLATSETDLAVIAGEEFDLSDPSTMGGLEGAVIVGVVFPGEFAAAAGLTPEAFVGSIMDGEMAENLQSEPFEHPSLTGDLLVASTETHSGIILPLLDTDGNFVLIIAFAVNERLEEVRGILTDVEYTQFDAAATYDAENLVSEIRLIPDLLTVNLPQGWWVLSSEGITMATPEMKASFLQAFSTNDFAGTEGFVIIAIEAEKSTMPAEVYNEDGSLNPEKITALLDVASLLAVEDMEAVTDIAVWSNENGLEGVSLVMGDGALAEGVVARLIFVEGGENLITMMGAGTAENWADYEGLAEAIFQTAQLAIEE